MKAKELFDAGRVDEAVRALGADLRDDPADTGRRMFLFDLLCFAGDYARAQKQLDIASGQLPEPEAQVCREALRAERIRQSLFEERKYPESPSAPDCPPVRINGNAFGSLIDCDDRIGSNLEVFAAGNYLLTPFRHIAWLKIPPPKRVRDLLWVPAELRMSPEFGEREAAWVLLPVLAPLTWRHSTDAVRLGRMTLWADAADPNVDPNADPPTMFGQKMFLADDEEIPLLEVRNLEVDHGSRR